jgi:hypothetical protein
MVFRMASLLDGDDTSMPALIGGTTDWTIGIEDKDS